MRISMLTLGTRGDFELLLTLGRRLRSRGHQVVLGTSEFYAARVREAEIEWAQIGCGTRDDLLAVLRSLSSVADKAKRTLLFQDKWIGPQLSLADGQIAAIAAGTDYFVSNLKIAVRRDGEIIPGAAVTYDPPRTIEDLSRSATHGHGASILDLVAMNKGLVDPESLWGEQYHFTGFWSDEQQAVRRPSPRLSEFLANGLPPVVITMGSMVMFDAWNLVRQIIAALGVCGRRGIIVSSWSGISPADVSEGPVYCVSQIPYDWLFAKASCIIHHGGCGTVAAVLRAGRPSILLPQVSCQEEFGRILARENLVAGVLDAQCLNHVDLAEAIQKAVADEELERNARKWQQAVLEDGGVELAAELIENHWKRINRDDCN